MVLTIKFFLQAIATHFEEAWEVRNNMSFIGGERVPISPVMKEYMKEE